MVYTPHFDCFSIWTRVIDTLNELAFPKDIECKLTYWLQVKSGVYFIMERRGAAPFTSEDYEQMHYFYGYARGNAAEAARLFREQVERRGDRAPEKWPDHRTILRVRDAYREGRVPGTIPGRPPLMRDPELVEEVIEEIERDPSVSVRTIEHRTGIPKSVAHRILQSEGYHPYHIQRVQQLKPGDYLKRVTFCQEMLRRQAANENFFKTILWTDESHFKRNGIFNIHNYHSWAVDNPHLARQSNFQEQFSVNLWSGIVNEQLIGPFQLPDRLDGEEYLNFLRNNLNPLLEEIDLETRRDMFFQHDGAPCHHARIVRDYLNRRFRNKWIGRDGPIAWPPRSPDLNPIDFFVWGYYKEIVYATEARNVDDMQRKINEAERIIKDNRMAFRQLKDNFFRRCRICIENEGRHFENFL